jgi:hypothetical protein
VIKEFGVRIPRRCNPGLKQVADLSFTVPDGKFRSVLSNEVDESADWWQSKELKGC